MLIWSLRLRRDGSSLASEARLRLRRMSLWLRRRPSRPPLFGGIRVNISFYDEKQKTPLPEIDIRSRFPYF